MCFLFHQSFPEKNPKLIGAKDGAPEVEFDHVCMTYEGAADETLTDISFTVQKGQTIGIIGGTGSGKIKPCKPYPEVL